MHLFLNPYLLAFMSSHFFRYLIALMAFCLPAFASAQQADSTQAVKTIEILHANKWNMIQHAVYGKSQRLQGHVKARHEQVLFYCDTAYIYSKNNDIEAFGHVVIVVNDSLEISADYLKYNAATRIAELQNNVVLNDGKKRLYTNNMIYERNTALATYWEWGKLVDSTNVLTSEKGYYYSRLKVAEFKDKVKVHTPDYEMFSDTLKYFTQRKEVYFLGPTKLYGDSTYAHAQTGHYKQLTGDLVLRKKALIDRKTNRIAGDYLYMNDSIGIAKARGHVLLSDTAQHVEVHGNKAYYNKHKRYAWVTGKAYAQHNGVQDTLYMHADTLKLTIDSLEKARHLMAYRGMRFYSHDMQGMADSLCYSLQDSVLRLQNDVFLWHQENQISCAWTDMYMRHGHADSAIFYGGVFLASQDTVDSQYYNQLTGETMYAWFGQRDIRKIHLSGQVHTNYFVWEEDGTPVGMFHIESHSLNIWLQKRKIKIATYYQQINSTTYPLDMLPPEKATLPNFEWKGQWRPRNMHDIFRPIGELVPSATSRPKQ